MASTTLIQNSFTSGELDPKLRGRTDLTAYLTGANKLRNVFVIPQGGVTRRPGLEYIDYQNQNSRMFEFNFDSQINYIIILTHLQAKVYREGELKATVVTTITESQIPDLTTAQKNDVILFFHEEFTPIYLARQDDTTWVSDIWTLKNKPTASFSAAGTAELTVLNKNSLDFDMEKWVDGNQEQGFIVADDTIFDASLVGLFIRGAYGQYFEILDFVSTTRLSVMVYTKCISEVGGVTKIPPNLWYYEEPVWSIGTGYPRCGTFFQGRLWMASTPQFPNRIWASRTGDETDFQNWLPSFDDNGMDVTASESRTPFHSMFGGKHLMIFSTSGVSFVPNSDTEPIIPTNITIQKATEIGSMKGLRQFDVHGKTIYMRSGGKSLQEADYTFAQGSYIPTDLNLLSSHIINDPKVVTYRKQTSTDDADYILVVNSDGTLSVLCSLASQNITAWTVCSTDGKFVDVAVEGDTMYFIIERNLDGVTVYCLERFNFDLFMDSGKIEQGINLSEMTGLDHLDNMEVGIVLDNTIQPDQIVTGGKVTFARNATEAQVGLKFPIVDTDTGSIVFIESMPIEIPSQSGPQLAKKKRVSEITAMLYETSHLIINKNKAAIRLIGVDKLDEGIPIRTENLTVSGILGWDDTVKISVGQTLALPLTLLGMIYRVRT